MAFNVIPKKEIERKPWLDWVFYFCFILLILSVLSYFVLAYSLQKTDEALNKVEAKISEQEQSKENKELKENLLEKEKKINDFSNILKKHRLYSELFSFIESLTHPEVVFANFNFTSVNLNLALSGKTSNFKTLGEQLLVLQAQSDIKSVELSNIFLMEDGSIDFNLDISLSPKIFDLIR